MLNVNRRFANEINTYNIEFDELNDTRKNWVRDFEKDSFILSEYNNRDALFIALIRNFIIPIRLSIYKYGNGERISYPFRPYDVKVGIYNYKSLLILNNFSRKILGRECMCCSTLLCGHNWTPQNTLYDLLTEIKNNLELKLRSIEIFHAIKIIDKYFGDAYRVLPIVYYL